jgi:broad specificity phosphatase PhoE
MPQAHVSDVKRIAVRAINTPPSNASHIRRITGSADIPISSEGREQAERMEARYSNKFNHVFCGPENRSIETAEQFGDPIVLKGLGAWPRGALEGKPAKQVNAVMRSLMTRPDVKPPGVSAFSGLPGKTYNQFLKPLIHVARALSEHLKPDERILVTTSGGDLQAIDHLAPHDFPSALDADLYKELAEKPYWSATGQLFLLTHKGLEKVKDNTAFGLYFIEHAGTEFNPPGNSSPV